jgi:hypothetical protein
VFAVAAAEQEDEPLQVATQFVWAVGGMAGEQYPDPAPPGTRPRFEVLWPVLAAKQR